MRKLVFLLPFAIILGFTLINTSKIETVDGEKFNVKINDSTETTIIQAINPETKLPVYYYSKLYVPACNTGECKIIDITMYWDIYGNYFKYTVPKASPLTKANHVEFKKSDYYKLHIILTDTTSSLKTLKFNELTEKQAGKRFKTDGKTGASIKFIGELHIKGAVKTSHTLWHIANDEAHDKIARATDKYFHNHKDLPTLFKNEPKSSTGIIKLLVDADRFNLTQTQYLIKSIEDNKIELKPIKSSIKNSFKTTNKDNVILFANFCLRNQYKSGKAKKVVKSINYLE